MKMLRYLYIAFISISLYLFIIFAIRLFGKKDVSQLSISDLVFVLLLSNSVQNAMVGADSSLAGGLVAATSLFVVNYITKLIVYRFPKIEHLIEGEPILLVYKGKINEKNLAKAKITKDELLEAVREHGVASLDDVELAVFEMDGNISIISERAESEYVKKKIPVRIKRRE
jgi:uncharacterized membrane protein YcaP (DUF421 family)